MTGSMEATGVRPSRTVRIGVAGRLLGRLALLVSLVWLVGLTLPAYRPLDRAVASGFPVDPVSWTADAPTGAVSFDGGVTLHERESATGRLFFTVPFERPADDIVRIRVSGHAAERRSIVPPTGTAALGIRFERVDGTGRYRNIRFAPGRYPAARFSKVLVWPEGLPVAHVGLTSRPGAPALTVRDARVELVRPDVRYALAMTALCVLVAIFLCSLLRYLVGRRAIAVLAIPVGVTAVILVGVSASPALMNMLFRPLIEALGAGLSIDPATVTKVVLKGGHGAGFFALAACLLHVRDRLGASRAATTIFLLLLALASEGVQTHLPDRGASLRDVAIDGTGILLALLLQWWFETSRRRRHHRSPEITD